MKWSLKLGTVAGIAVYLHWTFAILIGWIFVSHLGEGKSVAQAFAGVAFILTLFGCVVLHELGHALAARRFGVGTRDITLLPIGGVARLERIPDKPMQELWVAVAGPLVNVAIAALLLIAMLVVNQVRTLVDFEWFRGQFLAQLMWVNLFIVAFNMLPAFPMDGGRVLRALLATRLGRRRATAIAANIGQFLAILLGIAGFFYNPFLIFIAIFVYLGAQGEAAHVEMESALDGLRVRDAMMTRFSALSAQDTLDRAVEQLLSGSQQDFPVLDDDRVVGILRRNDLVKALSEGRRGAPVSEAMSRNCRPVADSDILTRTLEAMRGNECATVPVLQDGRLVGLLTLENIGELVMVRSAVEATTGAAASGSAGSLKDPASVVDA